VVTDETEELRYALDISLDKALNAIWLLGDYFGRETISSAIGEISERLIAQYLHASRKPRATRGHDIITPSGELIEVKARFTSKYGDALQFNFGKHTRNASVAYCLAWAGSEKERPHLQCAMRCPVATLLERWPNSKNYCARTTLGALRSAIGKPDSKNLAVTLEGVDEPTFDE
jgi:hypothetical protein